MNLQRGRERERDDFNQRPAVVEPYPDSAKPAAFIKFIIDDDVDASDAANGL